VPPTVSSAQLGLKPAGGGCEGAGGGDGAGLFEADAPGVIVDEGVGAGDADTHTMRRRVCALWSTTATTPALSIPTPCGKMKVATPRGPSIVPDVEVPATVSAAPSTTDTLRSRKLLLSESMSERVPGSNRRPPTEVENLTAEKGPSAKPLRPDPESVDTRAVTIETFRMR
jgi:hypothetical protein